MSETKFTTTALTPATTTKFAAELADGSKGHVLHSALGISDTWTPVLTFATPGDLNVAYAANSQKGRYIRIGNLVLVSFAIITSTFTHGSASGNLQITGFPLTALTDTGINYYGSLRWGGITKANYTHISPTIASGGSTILLSASGSAQSPAAVQAADTPTGGTITLVGNLVLQVA